MSEQNSDNNSSEAIEKKSGFFKRSWSFFKDHTNSALKGVLAGVAILAGWALGLVAAVYTGVTLTTALVVSGGTAVISGQKVRKLLKPKKKLSFYSAMGLTIVGITGAFNMAVDNHEKLLEVKNNISHSDIVIHKKTPANYSQFKLVKKPLIKI